jgi:hypothetical protein
MEYEKWSRNGNPNWRWIKDEIQKSRALFLILAKNIVKKEYTQNWVAFEIGVASTCNPPIPVFVFKEENIDFPVPYLNHYFDQPLSNTTRLFSKDLSKDLSLAFLNVHPLKKVTKDICDKCFNEIKPNATDRIRRYNKAQTILDGEDRTGIVESREGM